MLEALVSFLGLCFIGIYGWAFQLNSRVSVLEQQHVDLKELIEEKFAGLDKSLYPRLDRIERSLNGHLVRE